MKAEGSCAPDFGVDQIAQDEERPEKTTMLPAPNYRKVSAQDLSNLSKIVREKPGVNDVCEGNKTGQEEEAEDCKWTP